MKCEHPDCTGKHRHVGDRREWCPAARERMASTGELWAINHPAQRYLTGLNSRARAREIDPDVLDVLEWL